MILMQIFLFDKSCASVRESLLLMLETKSSLYLLIIERSAKWVIGRMFMTNDLVNPAVI